MIVISKPKIQGFRANHVSLSAFVDYAPEVTTYTSESIAISGILRPFELTEFSLTEFSLTSFSLVLQGSTTSKVSGFSIGFDGGFS